MSSLDRISAIAGISAVSPYADPYRTASNATAASVASVSPADSFSSVLDSVSAQGVSAADASSTASDSSTSSNDDQTVTITQVLADGSLLIKEMRGNEVVSVQKLTLAQMGQQSSGDAAMRAYTMAGYAGASAGLLFSTSV